ncbi:MAG TPA: TonB family protein [Bryobacteraceae bacterium]|nr:TonB family protein [Bryobacteraceae bacterium]
MNATERIRAALTQSKAGLQTSESDSDNTLFGASKADLETMSVSVDVREPAAQPEASAVLPLLATNQASAPAAPSKAAPSTVPQQKAGGFPAVTVVIGVLVLAAGGAAFAFRDRWLNTKPAAAASVAVAPALQLNVDSESNGRFIVRWNPASAAVTEAAHGQLVIAEGDKPARTVALDPEQLRSGHLLYQSSADRLDFRLEVSGASGTILKESVLALSSGTPSAPAPVQSAPAPAVPAKTPATPPEKPQQVAKVEEPQVVRPVRQFTPPPPTQRNQADGRPVVLDAPAPSALPAGSLVANPNLNLPGALSRPAPSAPPPSSQPGKPLRVGGNVQSAKLIRRVTPVYPAVARSARISGMVRFTATIAKNGTVQNLQVLSGPEALVQAARDAVKQWVYQPTTLNGEPVEVITQIDVAFTLRD